MFLAGLIITVLETRRQQEVIKRYALAEAAKSHPGISDKANKGNSPMRMRLMEVRIMNLNAD